MERTGQGQEKEEWGMLKQIKVITVSLHRKKSDRTYHTPHMPTPEFHQVQLSSLGRTVNVFFEKIILVWLHWHHIMFVWQLETTTAHFSFCQTMSSEWAVSIPVSISVKNKLWSTVGPRGRRQSSSGDWKTV